MAVDRAKINARRKTAKSRAYDVAYMKRPHVKAKRDGWRWKRVYGITREAWEAQLAWQKGCCAICEGPKPTWGNWLIDHDHRTGVFRGLLCRKCNTGLGLFQDSEHVLARALNYLREVRL